MTAELNPTDLPTYLRGYAGGGIPRMHDAARRIEQLQAALIECGTIAALCQHEMQGRLADDEHRRAFRALERIKETVHGVR